MLHQVLGFAVDEELLAASAAQPVRLARPRRYEASFLADRVEAVDDFVTQAG